MWCLTLSFIENEQIILLENVYEIQESIFIYIYKKALILERLGKGKL